MTAEIIPYLPPVDDIVTKLSVAVEQLSLTPWSIIANAKYTDDETGEEFFVHQQLREIAVMICRNIEMALDDERAKRLIKARQS